MSSLIINNAKGLIKSLSYELLKRDEVLQHVLSTTYVDQPILVAEKVQGFVQIFS